MREGRFGHDGEGVQVEAWGGLWRAAQHGILRLADFDPTTYAERDPCQSVSTSTHIPARYGVVIAAALPSP